MKKETKLNILGLFSAAGAVVCFVSALGFVGRVWWALELASHFRVQYVLILLVFSVVFAAARKWKPCAVFVVFFLMNVSVVVPVYLKPDLKGTVSEQSYRAMLINVHSSNDRYDLVTELIRQSEPDLVVLEEVNTDWMQGVMGIEKDYPYSTSKLRDDNFGIALFSRIPLESSDVKYIGADGLPSIVATIHTQTSVLTLIGTHPLPPMSRAYADSRNEQMNSLARYAKKAQKQGPVMLLGDLNTTPWSFKFGDLIDQSGLHDSRRGFGVQTSWPSFFWPLRIPIDHCLHSGDIHIQNRRIGPDVGSDHLPVIVDFTVSEQKD